MNYLAIEQYCNGSSETGKVRYITVAEYCTRARCLSDVVIHSGEPVYELRSKELKK